MSYIYSPDELKQMIEHWVATQPNSYLGYGYGFNLHEMLLKPLTPIEADFILKELKNNVPPLLHLSDDQLSIHHIGTEYNDTHRYAIVLYDNKNLQIELG